MGVIGNGSDSKSEILGSSPSAPTNFLCDELLRSEEVL